jgi:DNA-binding NarL/FixJ family response regulator
MKKHILLIETSQNGYKEFMDVLASVGVDCKVTYTNDYEHAMEILKYISPDCIFMRIDIREVKSIEWVRQIKNRICQATIKLIVYDDEVTGSMIRQSIMQGADYCIDRPCSFADMNYLLKDVFKS